LYFCPTDDNDEPDPQYEEFMAKFGEDSEEEITEKPKNKHRARYARSPKHKARYNPESDEDNESNPAQPDSETAPDSNTRRQEFLAKAAAAAGSK
jgi:hypothetical protein